MSGTKRIHFSTDIAAPVERVWDTMLEPDGFSRWTEAFHEGSRYEGAWETGSRIRFLTPAGDGMVAEIAERRLHERVVIRHLGIVKGGVEDTDSVAARAWAPASEIYRFSPAGEGTRLDVELDVTPDNEHYMRVTWPRALARLKALCEAPDGA